MLDPVSGREATAMLCNFVRKVEIEAHVCDHN